MRFQCAWRRAALLPLLILRLLAPIPVAAQKAASLTDAELATRLAAIEKTIDSARQDLHIPGAALVIVKDDKVIYMKGLGLRDVERKLPVTPDTLFAIGSSTKAFTAMTVMMSVDDGKLSLSDSPKKFLPYFKLQDPEADKKITLTDLLCHRSGLDRTDLLFISGVLKPEELIRALAFIKPTAKLGERFQYQNLMFLTAGEMASKAQGEPWQKVVAERIFQPLGMTSTNTSVRQTLRSPDHALGYEYDADTKETRHLPMRDITYIAPAGAINSDVKDMGEWVRFMLNDGIYEDDRLVSERSFRELTVKRIKVAGNIDYGFGWFLRDWNGHRVVEHGGNIDGFNAEVALMPDQRLGFVLLTNVTASTLGETAMTAVWDNLVGAPPAPSEGVVLAVDKLVGTYHSEDLNLDFAIAMKDGKLTAGRVGGKDTPVLESAGGNRYKVGPPAPAGVFVSFHPAKENPQEIEMTLNQGGASFVFKPQTPGDTARQNAEAAAYNGPGRELIGSYKATGAPLTIEVTVKKGKVSLVVAGQPAYPLKEKAKDQYALGGLPDSFVLLVKRDGAGKVSGATLKQPQGDMELTRAGATAAQPAANLPSMDTVMQKEIEAEGGEANLRRHRSLAVEMTLDMPTQGVTGRVTVSARAPDALTTETTMFALGKKLLTERDYFDGERGGEESSISLARVKTGKALAAAAIEADFYRGVDWKKRFKTVTVTGIEKVGGEEAYVVEETPAEGSPITDYISTKSFLLLRRDTTVDNPTVGSIPTTETYSDYRKVKGLMIPFKRVTSSPLGGETTSVVTRIAFDVSLPDTVFQPRQP